MLRQHGTTTQFRTPETSTRAARELPMLTLNLPSRNQSDGILSGAVDVRLN